MMTTVQYLRIRKIRSALTATVTPEFLGSERPILTTHRLQAAMHAMKTRDRQIRIRRPVIVTNVTLMQAIPGWELFMTTLRPRHHVHYVMRTHVQYLRTRKIWIALSVITSPEGCGWE
jgi:hypothetical protein